MVNEMYEGMGKSLESALKDLHTNSKGQSANLKDVTYAVKLADPNGEFLGEGNNKSYDKAFQAALQDAGIGPGDYSPRKHKINVTASAPAVFAKKKGSARASGSDGKKYSTSTLTNLF